MTAIDPVRRLLAQRGCAEHVVERGLEGLLAAWTRSVSEIARGYRFGLDDYCNDMDGRQLLADALAATDPTSRGAITSTLAELDSRVNELLSAPGACIWGAELARENGWNAGANWWYFRTPKRPGSELAEDLATWGRESGSA